MNGKETGQTGPLKGFTEGETDLSLYESFSEYEIRKASFVTDLWDEAYDYLKRSGVKGSDTIFPNRVKINKSKNLERFLRDNRPKTLFFDPAEIAQLLSLRSNIRAEHKKTKKYEQWKFSLNPQVDKQDIHYEMTYKRPLVDVDSGKFRPHHPEPYIVVEFPAAYDGTHVIFSPEIRITYGDPWPRIPKGELEKQMLILLGVPEKKVEQRLGFRLQKKQESFPDGETFNSYFVTLGVVQSKS